VAPSKLTLIRRIPASTIRRALSEEIRVPLGAITIRNPNSVPYAAISKISARIMGSPPVRIMMGFANATT